MLDRVLGVASVVPFLLGTTAGPTGVPAEVAFRFQDRAIVESSSLVARGGLVLTTNDSGDGGRVFAVDPRTGETVGTTSWDREPEDLEALAPAGPGRVWVGDIGDNRGTRDHVEVLRVPYARARLHVDPRPYPLVYPDGARDAEALLADPRTGRLYVVSKDVFGGTLYAAPRHLDAGRPNRLRPVADAPPAVTDGAFFADGRHYVLRSYSRATIYSSADHREVVSFRLPDQQQGEGIATTRDGDVLLSTEGQYSDVLRVRLPRSVEDRLAPPPATSTAQSSGSSSPSSGSSRAPAPTGDDSTPAELHRDPWPWLLGGLIGVAMIAVLLRSLRPR